MTEAIEKLRTVSLHIDESAGLNSSELRANARRLARKCGKLGLIVVDYLQLMSGSGGGSNGENRATERERAHSVRARVEGVKQVSEYEHREARRARLWRPTDSADEPFDLRHSDP